MDELVTWEGWRSLAAMISALCAIIAATVSVAVWRKARVSDLADRIDDGDAQNASAIEELRDDVHKVQTAVAQIQVDTGHMLRPRDLGRVHEKINAVAENTAETRAHVNALREQVNVIHRLLMEARK